MSARVADGGSAANWGSVMFKFLSRYWWVLVFRGAIAILFGVMAFTLPLQTVAALVLVFGAFAFVDGIAAMATGIGGRDLTRDWWILLLQGLLGVGIGLVTLLSPAITAVALLLYIAAWAILLGALQIYAAIKLRDEFTGEWALALGGVLAIAFGLLMLWRPGVGALAVLWVIASYAIVSGILLVVGGFSVRRTRQVPAA